MSQFSALKFLQKIPRKFEEKNHVETITQKLSYLKAMSFKDVQIEDDVKENMLADVSCFKVSVCRFDMWING